MARRGVYAGSFNPPTVAHVAIAEAAVAQRRLDRVVFALSQVPLAKEAVDGPDVYERADWIREATAGRPWAEIAVVEEGLIADIASGYDVVIMGADKWEQVNDPVFYGGSTRARDAAIARLPELAIAPRTGSSAPTDACLELPQWLRDVSATAVRQGAHHWRAPRPKC